MNDATIYYKKCYHHCIAIPLWNSCMSCNLRNTHKKVTSFYEFCTFCANQKIDTFGLWVVACTCKIHQRPKFLTKERTICTKMRGHVASVKGTHNWSFGYRLHHTNRKHLPMNGQILFLTWTLEQDLYCVIIQFTSSWLLCAIVKGHLCNHFFVMSPFISSLVVYPTKLQLMTCVEHLKR
jgi:hypothetical protein